MIILQKPLLEHEMQYREMISEWRGNKPYTPCIIDFDCNTDDFNYKDTLKVVNDYSNGQIFDYDVDYFKSSDFYFIFDDDNLVGMCQIRNGLKELGVQTLGHMACGIRPSMRRKGYAYEASKIMLEKLKTRGVSEVVVCHYSENEISPKVIKKLGFNYRNSVVSKVTGKEIKCYTKII